MLGREVLRQLPDAFAPVCIGRSRPTISRAFDYIEADLGNTDFVARLPNRIDAVMHLAQSENYEAFPAQAFSVFTVNAASTAALLEWGLAAGATHFILASTGGLYGAGPRPFKETDHLSMSGRLAYYLSTKYAAEIIANAYRDSLNVVCLRYFFIYGLNQRPSMLVPRLIDAVSSERPIILAGEDGIRLNPVDVRDAAAASIAALAVESSKTINVAGPDVVSIRQLGEIIATEIGKAPVFQQTGPVDADGLVADISLMSACLGAPRIAIREGIAHMCGAGLKVGASLQ